jgi:hypothetical protein
MKEIDFIDEVSYIVRTHFSDANYFFEFITPHHNYEKISNWSISRLYPSTHVNLESTFNNLLQTQRLIGLDRLLCLSYEAKIIDHENIENFIVHAKHFNQSLYFHRGSEHNKTSKLNDSSKYLITMNEPIVLFQPSESISNIIKAFSKLQSPSFQWSNIFSMNFTSSFIPVENYLSSPLSISHEISSIPLKTVIEKCHARIGLMGNPSDGFGGKTLSCLISNFEATVTITEVDSLEFQKDPPVDNTSSSRGVRIQSNPHHDKSNFTGIDDLFTHSCIHGYYGGARLLQATCKMFVHRCAKYSVLSHTWHQRQKKDIIISYETDIPRMVIKPL